MQNQERIIEMMANVIVNSFNNLEIEKAVYGEALAIFQDLGFNEHNINCDHEEYDPKKELIYYKILGQLTNSLVLKALIYLEPEYIFTELTSI